MYPGWAMLFRGHAIWRSCSQYSLKTLSFSSPAQQVSGSQNRYSSLAADFRPRTVFAAFYLNHGTATVNEFHSFRRGSSDYSVNNMPLIYFNQRGFFPCQFTTIILHAFISATSLSLSFSNDRWI